MVHFAVPGCLGDKATFKSDFDLPISASQCIDSTEDDVELARKRVMVLAYKLRDIVLRRGPKVRRRVDEARCGDVEIWRCGDMEMWRCGDVEMWRCDEVVRWQIGVVVR